MNEMACTVDTIEKKQVGDLKIALVHDYLNQFGGAERCLEALHELFPQAPIFTLVYDKRALPAYESWDIRPSLLQYAPGAKQHYQYYLWSFPLVVKTFDVQDFDIIISISHAWVKGIRTNTRPHISYCLTPIRYAWDLYEEYATHEYIPAVVRKCLPLIAKCLRTWDKKQAQGVDQFIAVSETVAKRIANYYGRTAEVIYPPVDTGFYCINKEVQREDFYITVSRLKAYKRIDLVIETFNRLGYPLKVIGSGPELKRLQKRAKGNVSFLTHLNHNEVLNYYQKAKGFVFAGVEDFGLVMAEAQATGLPVIAYGKGGATEIVEDGISGVLVPHQTAEDFVEAIQRFEAMTFVVEKVRAASYRFDRTQFKNKISNFVMKYVGKSS
ncbi:MAG: glycosyltransferase [Candidatus Omnitrophica bacterium]|nr:glycosyltransferase [Candidatus Omnitrophota bacterium]